MCKHRSRWVALFSATTPATTVTAVPSAGGSGMKCPGPVAFSQAMVDLHRAAADPPRGGRSPAGTGHTHVPHQRVPEFLPPARDRPRRSCRGAGGGGRDHPGTTATWTPCPGHRCVVTGPLGHSGPRPRQRGTTCRRGCPWFPGLCGRTLTRRPDPVGHASCQIVWSLLI